ncbi:MAG: hypothetical protein AB7O91_05730 [Sphingomonas sp.]
MRIMVGLSLGIVGLSGLAACGENDEAFRARYRTEAVATCVQGARTSNPAGLDPNRFCGCMVDGYMEGTSSEQLKAERGQATPPPNAQRAIEQCARQLMGGGQQGAASNALNGGNAAAESDEGE